VDGLVPGAPQRDGETRTSLGAHWKADGRPWRSFAAVGR
jgi:hypothetical protein